MARLGSLLVAAILAHGSTAVHAPSDQTHSGLEQRVSCLTPTHGSEVDTDFLRVRKQTGTQLATVGPAPDLYRDPATTEGMRLSRYLSDGNELKVWQLVASNKRLWSERGYPVVVYVHDGTTMTEDELTHAQTFRDAGFWVVLPTFRGENGNFGAHELLFGELEDLVAATHFTATLPEIDPARIAIFGHGYRWHVERACRLGAAVAGANQRKLGRTAARECFRGPAGPLHRFAARTTPTPFGPNIEQMQSPHLACVAERDPAVYAEAQRLRTLALEGSSPLSLLRVSGSRSGSRDDCEQRAALFLAQAPVMNAASVK